MKRPVMRTRRQATLANWLIAIALAALVMIAANVVLLWMLS